MAVSETPLRVLTLGRALADLGRVEEDEGPNLSKEIRAAFASLDPPVIISDDAVSGYPWCAAFVQHWSDQAAQLHGVRNPLDAVAHEAWCPDYAIAGDKRGWIVAPADADAGCIVLFNFRGIRWDHVALLTAPPTEEGRAVVVHSVDANTNIAGSRDGDRVMKKTRRMNRSNVLFLKWDEGEAWQNPEDG